MAFTMFGRTIRKIGVIGSGNIGPDIALHFSQNLYGHGVPVVVVDIVQAALKLVIELDGGQHTMQKSYDKKRMVFFRNKVSQFCGFGIMT